MIKILVTGSGGQLGQCIRKAFITYDNLSFTFTNSNTLDICNRKLIEDIFHFTPFDYCINCAAYTNVDLAEQEKEKAFEVNHLATSYLSAVCKAHNTTLIHISTDYVFDGQSMLPYDITHPTNPINIYGKSKLDGENAVRKTLTDYFIIRTSWVYSEFGKNFYKTICQKLKTEKELYVINDQVGQPTDANNLTKIILNLISSNDKNFGTHHFSGKQIMTWFDFAKSIAQEKKSNIKIYPIDSNYYKSIAQRPKYSVLKNTLMLT